MIGLLPIVISERLGGKLVFAPTYFPPEETDGYPNYLSLKAHRAEPWRTPGANPAPFKICAAPIIRYSAGANLA